MAKPTITCKNCGTVFVKKDSHRSRTQTYCSRKCADVGKRKPGRPCQRCGVAFRNTSPKRRYCSKDCYYKHRKETASKPCLTCGAMFMPSGKTHRYCSESCRTIGRRSGTYKTCPICNGEFYAPPDRPTMVYCSNGCYQKRPVSHKMSQGYVYTQRNNKRIFVHRAVMAEFLGRDLLPSENVHHKNGDRADNRIENLELWTRSQPSGSRVEDKLKWAIEIINLYGGYHDPN